MIKKPQHLWLTLNNDGSNTHIALFKKENDRQSAEYVEAWAYEQAITALDLVSKQNAKLIEVIEMYKKAIVTAQAYNTRTINKIESMMSSLGK